MRFLALLDGAVAGMHFSCSQPTIRWLSSSLAVSIDDGLEGLDQEAGSKACDVNDTDGASQTDTAREAVADVSRHGRSRAAIISS